MAIQDMLVIGANFLNHDSGIFCIDVTRERAFGMTTERITRYKHDTLPPMPVVQELLREWQIDSRTIRRVLVATSLRTQMRSQVKRELYTEVSSLRGALGPRYLKEVVRQTDQYRSLSPAGRLWLMLKSGPGRRYLVSHFAKDPRGVAFPQMVAA